MLYKPFYDPEKSYEENLKDGPFGDFADGKIFEEKGEPKYDFFGYKVYSPFGIPAGPLINGKFMKSAFEKGFDICIYKTVRTKKYLCHPWPNVLSVEIDGDLTLEKAGGKLIANRNYREPLSITNSFGVPSSDPKIWQKDISSMLKNIKKGQVIIVGFQGTKQDGGNVESYINDFSLCAKMLKDIGVKVMEVNLSCPNEGSANLLCFDKDRSVAVVKTIKKEIGDIPLIVKIAYFKDDEVLRALIREIGQIANGISAINTIPSEIINKEGGYALPGLGREVSGVCGYSIKWAGLDMVRRLRAIREELGYKYTIIGVGGVTTPEDFLEYRNAGADVVMSATGAIWNPYLAQEIKKIIIKE
jgi:dihydroorotate dehydrogenase